MKIIKKILQVIVILFASLMVAATIRKYVAEVYEISGRSMEPTLRDQNRIIICKLGSISRGDIVVLHAPDEDKIYVKRVVGLPNETVLFAGNRLFINNQALEEGYTIPEVLQGEAFCRLTCGPNEYVILGDNRPNSYDSRVFGPVRKETIIGKMVFLW